CSDVGVLIRLRGFIEKTFFEPTEETKIQVSDLVKRMYVVNDFENITEQLMRNIDISRSSTKRFFEASTKVQNSEKIARLLEDIFKEISIFQKNIVQLQQALNKSIEEIQESEQDSEILKVLKDTSGEVKSIQMHINNSYRNLQTCWNLSPDDSLLPPNLRLVPPQLGAMAAALESYGVVPKAND
ncbi:MAG: hypothetical protein JXA94_04945, partial [Parachlamydiales bacterium]|nr:hypothetical protein [Parachlamydiales bacterium]